MSRVSHELACQLGATSWCLSGVRGAGYYLLPLAVPVRKQITVVAVAGALSCHCQPRQLVLRCCGRGDARGSGHGHGSRGWDSPDEGEGQEGREEAGHAGGVSIINSETTGSWGCLNTSPEGYFALYAADHHTFTSVTRLAWQRLKASLRNVLALAAWPNVARFLSHTCPGHDLPADTTIGAWLGTGSSVSDIH